LPECDRAALLRDTIAEDRVFVYFSKGAIATKTECDRGETGKDDRTALLRGTIMDGIGRGD
jgi:hypothetical protein